MAYTRYTQAQLEAMSDNEINETLANMLGHGCVMFSGVKCPAYCASWDATGPLMIDYKISLIDQTDSLDNGYTAVSNAEIGEDGSLNYEESAWSPPWAPLRAVVECLILVLQECE